MTLRKRFDDRGFAVNAYARAHDLVVDSLLRTLSGEAKGIRAGRRGTYSEVQLCILQLHKDGVWSEELPFKLLEEESDESKRVS